MVAKIQKIYANTFCDECKRVIPATDEVLTYLDQWGEIKKVICFDCAEKNGELY